MYENHIFRHSHLDHFNAETVAKLTGAVFCYMARTLHGSQEELLERMNPYGVEVAFDGYETEI